MTARDSRIERPASNSASTIVIAVSVTHTHIERKEGNKTRCERERESHRMRAGSYERVGAVQVARWIG